jgi:hypothetical protein
VNLTFTKRYFIGNIHTGWFTDRVIVMIALFLF